MVGWICGLARRSGGRAVAVDRGEEVAATAVRRGAAMHDVAHTNSICPDGTHVLRSLASFESCNAAAECVHHEPHADPDA